MKPRTSQECIYKEVVIIGNGPSGIALSYMLSGNLPFLTSDLHPDDMLAMRLRPGVNQCLIQQDLPHLAAGLEGRSTNPISLLLDSLLHPCADIGLEVDPLVEFRKIGTEIDHVVLGNGPPGGSWHKMDPYILTLSLGSWMSLPGLPFHCRDSGEKRAYASNVAKYYVEYVKTMNLSHHFINNAIATSAKPLQGMEYEEDIAERLSQSELVKTCPLSNVLNFLFTRRKLRPNRCNKRPLCQGHCPQNSVPKPIPSRRDRDRSVSLSCDSTNSCDSFHSSSFSLRNSHSLDLRVPFQIHCTDEQCFWVVDTCNVESGERITYRCKYLVLANGASDLPNRLEFSKGREDPSWLFHDLRTLEYHLDESLQRGNEEIDPILIVGAGLSAADAVIAVRGRNVPVIHVFRNKSADLNRQLPENMYPEYHKVHQMMQDGGSTYPFYTAYPEYHLANIDEANHSVVLTSKSGETVKVRVSFVAVLIGASPDLSFLSETNTALNNKTNTLNINKLTHAVSGYENLFAIGPLAGDNFVRFTPGGALAVVSELYRQNLNYSKLE